MEAKEALLKKIPRKIESATRNSSIAASALDLAETRLGRLAVLVITVRRTIEGSPTKTEVSTTKIEGSPTNYLARSLEPLIR